MELGVRGLTAYMGARAPFLLGRKGLEVACGLAVFAVLVRALSPVEFGIYTLVLGIVDMARVSGLPGLGNAQAQGFARGHRGGFARAVRLSLAGSVLGAAVLLSMALWRLLDGETATAFALSAAAVAFVPFAGLTFWRNAAVGLDRYAELMVWDGAAALLRTVAVIACVLAFPEPLVPAVVATFLAPALVNALATYRRVRTLPSEATAEAGAVRYGIAVSVYELPAVVAQNIDRLALFYLASPAVLALYAVAVRVPNLLQMVGSELIATLDPYFAKQKRFSRAMHRFTLQFGLVYLAVAVAFALGVVPWLLPLLAGQDYANAVPYAQVLTVGAALGSLGRIHFRFIKSQLDSRRFLEIVLLRSGIAIVLAVGLTAAFGLIGAVIAYVLRDLIGSLVVAVVVAKHYSITADSDPEEKNP